MNVKIFMHLMPWELDDVSKILDKIASSKRYLNPADNICVETSLNLSSYIINWENSNIPKQFFIDKYKYIQNSLYEFNSKSSIYDGNELHGCLDFQRQVIESSIDYYIPLCPDIYFHNHSLFYLIESAKNIKDEYFVITTETPKLWDQTWDVLTNKNFKDAKYSNWDNQNINELIYFSENNNEEPYLEKINQFKWAGWFDLYNKNFFEKLVPSFDDWHGYGPWDYFGINVCNIAKYNFNTNVNQYVLRNQIVFDKDIGIFQNKKNPSPYKKYLCFNNIPNQRQVFESKINEYIYRWQEYAKINKII